MKPVFFPFTFITQPVADALSACFGQTVVYQPLYSTIPQIMKDWEKSGIIGIRVPIKGDEEKVISICKAYREWMDTHQGSEINVLKVQGDRVPFLDESYATQIKAALKRNGKKTVTRDESETLFAARVFLNIAQQYDKELFFIFTASWCGPCKKMKAEVWPDERVQGLLKEYVVYVVDVDRERAVADRMRVKTIPAYGIFEVLSGKVKPLRIASGGRNVEEFVTWLTEDDS